MIQKIIPFFIASLLFVPFLVAGEEAAVEAVERTWAKAMEENDFETLERVLADDLYYSHSNFLEDSKQSYIGNLKSGKSRYYVLDIQSLRVRLLDNNTALTMAVAEYQTKAPDGSRQTSILKTLHVYRKNNGQWQMTAHQSAKKPE
ncbi:MAG: nuclear transport factor 2 family protein [bacterium]